jgi:diguanylate cyclase (GGDEF)-like protein/PAS domain S-box-containing protein
MDSPPGDGRRSAPSDAALDRVLFDNLLANSTEMIYFKDLTSRFLRVSKAQSDRLGVDDPQDVIGLSDFDFFDGLHADQAYADEQRILASGEPLINYEERETWPDRDDTWVSSTKIPLVGPDGTVIGTFGISRDATARVMAERQLAEQARELAEANSHLAQVERELRMVLDASPDAIIKLGGDLDYHFVNPAAVRMFGRSGAARTDAPGGGLGKPSEICREWDAALREALDTGVSSEFDFAYQRHGQPRWLHSHVVPEFDAGGEVCGILVTSRDVTDRKRAELVLEYQATHDQVTGLANRAHLMCRLRGSLARLQRHRSAVALLFVDLDDFKVVNDALGHAVGDWLLTQVAERMRLVARRGDVVARFGGDEFVILCEDVSDPTDAGRLAERVGAAVSEPLHHGGSALQVGASIGIAITDNWETDVDGFVRTADLAMYQAKEAGRGTYRMAT